MYNRNVNALGKSKINVGYLKDRKKLPWSKKNLDKYRFRQALRFLIIQQLNSFYLWWEKYKNYFVYYFLLKQYAQVISAPLEGGGRRWKVESLAFQ